MVYCDKILAIQQDGYDLYKELHQDPINQYIHGIGMPFVGLGLFIWLPALLKYYKSSAEFLNMAIVLSYYLYYLTWDPPGAVLCYTLYFCIQSALPYRYFTKRNRYKLLTIGFSIMSISLIAQEIIGHSLFEQKNSNLCHVPNSIMIAPLFGVRALMQRV